MSEVGVRSHFPPVLPSQLYLTSVFTLHQSLPPVPVHRILLSTVRSGFVHTVRPFHFSSVPHESCCGGSPGPRGRWSLHPRGEKVLRLDDLTQTTSPSRGFGEIGVESVIP